MKLVTFDLLYGVPVGTVGSLYFLFLYRCLFGCVLCLWYKHTPVCVLVHRCMHRSKVGTKCPLSLCLISWRRGFSLNPELVFFQLAWQPPSPSDSPVPACHPHSPGVMGTQGSKLALVWVDAEICAASAHTTKPSLQLTTGSLRKQTGLSQ